jgi:uncharacterized surface protein with fasciclin (FAS1) repeats
MKTKLISLLTLTLFILFSVSTVSAEDYVLNIMDIAAADDRFDTLETAVKAAGLADTLAAPGSLTVFAPTDDAFAKLPSSLINSLLADPKGALTDVLLYHVAGSSLASSDVLGMSTMPTVQGGSLNVSLRDGLPYVNDSQIIITDIQAKNGIIHVIDTVLVPPVNLPAAPTTTDDAAAPGGSIVDIAVADGRFNTLVAAVTAADLATTLAGPGSFTVFAPTDDAFAALPAGTVESLLADPEGALTTILLYHVIGDSLSRDQLATDTWLPTLAANKTLYVNRDGSSIIDVGGAKLLITDIQASNGIIHVIDRVLLP